MSPHNALNLMLGPEQYSYFPLFVSICRLYHANKQTALTAPLTGRTIQNLSKVKTFRAEFYCN